MSRQVDPIHFFNHYGDSVLSNAHLIAQNQKLEQENTELKRRVRSLATRLKAIGEGERQEKDIQLDS